ncbi:glucose-6-phosphate isomerase [Buchnera aphidicola str. APS (Acyrthosiphon pisum)]|uniref:Glucose-6-phosphate isomerase n=2 Tax=Buchnera aphidicola (Acyrthosiphon pisum) TaxID=118099 RepID=G6PI_BUCAI|nr:glucose-6-phosphate isomerase [Buchnera aphidicola]B8D894.1 RecName: Full=Glucose-6-phosphate isomerase; Short=GPI; AltName: Full=Phosphoglucose isomerase; Short=PGI; AltName: Full=Phosphohexose isomerase; Short=PHI [Buchnera aphidicola str. Tuc7 (Acyrthosiphon pisum)]P57636.1 RecName: Full=Glucose-6-phosphate isomerase; Short=GPI; AltName: Full=Phosphoglucose isomerase; Short=PGI; AltName: Full=Phosphohexose isomerase; Short=PHI [Buchnera aphidicola str. APS (Acyrthosiphon pisum)]pir/G84996/
MKNINFNNTQSYQDLKNHFRKIKNIHLRDLFASDLNRFKKFSIIFENEMLIDFSKNRITDETLIYLLNLAKETDVKSGIKLMFSGAKINKTENRSVLHIALRNRTNRPIILNNCNIMLEVNALLEKMKNFSKMVIHGEWKGYTGKSISNVVNIGIGGSDLGPYMVTEALRPYKNHLNMYYVSNIDGTHLTEVLKKINPENTIFLIASKTFTTDETITNAHSAKKWFLHYSQDQSALDKHFFALSANIKNALNFGININNIFKFWDWVGGRFSLWSSAGLSIMLSIGFDNFEKFLDGAHAMDNHFYHTNYKENIPILLALISIWYTNFFGSETEAIFPYDQYMHRFSAYFQQSNMESNGKSINRNGQRINYQTGPIIWGEPGTNGQHAFYQLIHQGTRLIPCDFIAPVFSHNDLNNHHMKLISNFFAQTQALAFGQSRDSILHRLILSKKNQDDIKRILPFKICKGNQPTNSILIRKITPYNLGALIALYEHKIFVQGYILNIFSFDQWGVELGKELSQNIYNYLNINVKNKSYDASTEGLINFYKSFMI